MTDGQKGEAPVAGPAPAARTPGVASEPETGSLAALALPGSSSVERRTSVDAYIPNVIEYHLKVKSPAQNVSPPLHITGPNTEKNIKSKTRIYPQVRRFHTCMDSLVWNWLYRAFDFCLGVWAVIAVWGRQWFSQGFLFSESGNAEGPQPEHLASRIARGTLWPSSGVPSQVSRMPRRQRSLGYKAHEVRDCRRSSEKRRNFVNRWFRDFMGTPELLCVIFSFIKGHSPLFFKGVWSFCLAWKCLFECEIFCLFVGFTFKILGVTIQTTLIFTLWKMNINDAYNFGFKMFNFQVEYILNLNITFKLIYCI